MEMHNKLTTNATFQHAMFTDNPHLTLPPPSILLFTLCSCSWTWPHWNEGSYEDEWCLSAYLPTLICSLRSCGGEFHGSVLPDSFTATQGTANKGLRLAGVAETLGSRDSDSEAWSSSDFNYGGNEVKTWRGYFTITVTEYFPGSTPLIWHHRWRDNAVRIGYNMLLFAVRLD